MKNLLFIKALLIVLACNLARGPLAFSRDGAATKLRAGAAAVDISPVTLPAIRNGGFLQATSNHVDDPLHARCLVLADGNETLALAIVDSCMFSTDLCDEIKSLVTKRIGLPSNRILISATHTHSAPSAMSHCLGAGQDDAYVNFVAPRVAEGIVAAHQRLQPAKVGWASVDAPELTNCRRWITRRDRMGTDPFGQRTVRAMMHPGYQNADYVCPAGPIDPELSVLSVVSAKDDSPLCLLANFSMHYFGAGGGFSADYFGEVARLLEVEISKDGDKPAAGFVGIMSQGTSGDLHWMDYRRPRRGVSRNQYSKEVATRILEAWTSIEHRADVTLAMAETRLKIRRRIPSEERLAWARPINANRGNRPPANLPEVYAQQAQWIAENQTSDVVVQAIRIGELGITAIPNEVYGITGLKLKQRSPLPATFNLELANGGEGYIPPPEQHRLGGYTTWPARSAGLEEQAEPKIVEAVLSLLETVSQKKRRNSVSPPCAYSQTILKAKPMAYWRLEDMAFTRAADATDQHHAQFKGGVALYLPGLNGAGLLEERRVNRGAYFAGGHIEAALNELTEDYSVSLWFWNGLPPDAQPIAGALFARGEADGRETLLLGGKADPTSNGRLIFRSGSRSFVGSTRLATKAWHHLALVRSKGRLLIYLDGQPTPELDAAVAQPAASPKIYLGGDGQSKESFDGKLDEIAIFARALSADEVGRHYKTAAMKRPPRPKPSLLLGPKRSDADALRRYEQAIVAAQPVAYWRLHDGDQRTAKDERRQHAAVYEHQARAFRPGGSAKNFTGGRLTAKVPKLGNTFSVEMWIRNELPNDARLVTGYLFSRGVDGAEGAPGDNLGIGGTHSSPGRLFLYNGNQRAESVAGTTTIVPGSWAHIALVRDGDLVKVYLNGDTDPEFEGNLPVTYADGCEQLMIGGRNDNFANFQGMIEEVAIYDRALKPAEVKAHFDVAGAEPLERSKVEDASVPKDRPGNNYSISNPLTRPSPPRGRGGCGSYFLDDPKPTTADESLKQIHVREGLEVQLVACEPLVRDPVAIDWGPDGKLWVVEMADYPLGMDGQGKPGGRVRFLQDTDGDGRYDTSQLFADGLSFPTGILTWGSGVLVTAAPEILYLEDTNGDGKADLRRTLYSGFLQGNQQLRVNGLRWGLDNWVYCASGSHHAGFGKGNQITSHITGATHRIGSRDFRIRPDTGEIDPQSGPSQYGRNRDDWGNWFGVQNSHPLWHYVLADHEIRRNPHFAPPDPRREVVTPANPRVYSASRLQKRYHSFEHSDRFTSACSAIIYRDDLLFPRGDQQHAFTCEPFHNLVQHNVITEEGVSFAFHRDPAEAKFDFFASEDRWCRPVMVRTGPDGALWVVDMYRYMIEHPEWLPKNGQDELRPFFRAGEDHGRIYRIVPVDAAARKIRRIAGLSAAELVAALEHPNGWQRDTAQRLLVSQMDPAAIQSLLKMFQTSVQPLARLHALCTLDGMDALKSEALERALSDPHGGVRRHAVRLAAGRAVDVARLTKLVNDEDAKVRRQLAATLGEFKDARAGRALAELAIASQDDPYLTATVMSSLNKDNVSDVVASVVQAVSKPSSSAGATHELLDQLIAQATAMGNEQTINKVIDLVCRQGSEAGDAGQWKSLALALDALSGRNWPVERLDENRRFRIRKTIEQSRAVVGDQGMAEELRAAAVSLLLRDSENRPADLKLMRRLIAPQTPLLVQRAVVARAAQRSDRQIADVLLAGWHSHSPALKAEILAVIASRAAWAESLLERLERRAIAAAEINPLVRASLSRTNDAAMKARWQKVFALGGSEDRETVVGEYRAALGLVGDASRGQAAFRKTCAACHRHGESGHEVGPNLASLTNKDSAALLTSILDPNAAVEAKYLSYIVITNEGRSFSGMLATETGSSINLLAGEGKSQTILRNDIDELETSGKSLMPEGLEKELSPQDIADVIRFVQQSSGAASKDNSKTP